MKTAAETTITIPCPDCGEEISLETVPQQGNKLTS